MKKILILLILATIAITAKPQAQNDIERKTYRPRFIWFDTADTINIDRLDFTIGVTVVVPETSDTVWIVGIHDTIDGHPTTRWPIAPNMIMPIGYDPKLKLDSLSIQGKAEFGVIITKFNQ